ncbi:hypothetical protein SAMN06295945_0487 [Polynucleobacter meluiroseus]|jgi:hypothetical protein|uniref:TM2 domain-containing protein n=1 Tax=Polynucleobacter meluiroseus TaxID=1938814 RepID=A0A240DY98_9BURK|nr:hypothetical protein [Polynucleobacter meluiroseus]SNX28165.1 hypothetical protein SAMN06295945_0487 [Polynucleobacter meluiroseus]
MKKYKLLFCALGLFLPGTGLNCFYLKGIRFFWGWAQLFALIGGIAGWLLLKEAHFHSAPGWVLITFGFIAIEASWLTTIALGLRPDEKWDQQFNPGLDPLNATQSGWPVILTVIFSLMLGAGVMMTFLAISFEQFFISQLQEAKKLSQ